MDAFTMVILACVAGEPTCTSAHVSQMEFVSAEACQARIDAVTSDMTRVFGKRPELKGRQVTYDVSCLNRTQLATLFGIAQSDT